MEELMENKKERLESLRDALKRKIAEENLNITFLKRCPIAVLGLIVTLVITTVGVSFSSLTLAYIISILGLLGISSLGVWSYFKYHNTLNNKENLESHLVKIEEQIALEETKDLSLENKEEIVEVPDLTYEELEKVDKPYTRVRQNNNWK